jgi:hypothetical protein
MINRYTTRPGLLSTLEDAEDVLLRHVRRLLGRKRISALTQSRQGIRQPVVNIVPAPEDDSIDRRGKREQLADGQSANGREAPLRGQMENGGPFGKRGDGILAKIT